MWEGNGTYRALGEGTVAGGQLLSGFPAVAALAVPFEALYALDRRADPCIRCGASAPHHVSARGYGVMMVCRFCALVQPARPSCGALAACAAAPGGHRRVGAEGEGSDGCVAGVCGGRSGPAFVHMWLPDREMKMAPPDPFCALCGVRQSRYQHVGGACLGRRVRRGG